MQIRKLKRLIVPTLLLLAIMLFAGRSILERMQDFVTANPEVKQKAADTFVILALAWFVTRLLEVLFFLVTPERVVGKTPHLLKNVTTLVVLMVAIGIVLMVTFGVPLNGLLATSGIAGVVMGLAFRDTIADVFAGISLNIERPFVIGDWVRLGGLESEELIGCVADIDWRTTHIHTPDNISVVVPNGKVRSMAITNLSRPEPSSRFRLSLGLDYGVAPERAVRILLAGAMSAEGPLADPGPKVRISDLGHENGYIEYTVYYWLNPASVSPHEGRHAVALSVLAHLKRAGISPTYPAKLHYLARQPALTVDSHANCRHLVKNLDIFDALESDARDQLANSSTEFRLESGATLLEEGETCACMYVLAEGLLHEHLASRDAAESTTPRKINPGQSVGEYSLLVGEPVPFPVVAATDCVLLKLQRETLQNLVAADSCNLKKLAEGLAQAEEQARGSLTDLSLVERTDLLETAAKEKIAQMQGSAGIQPRDRI